jgi:hypothetical protein
MVKIKMVKIIMTKPTTIKMNLAKNKHEWNNYG